MSVPAAPVLRGRNNGNAAAKLIWPPVAGATGYNLYRGTASGSADVNGRNEKQLITSSAVSGTYTLTYEGDETAPIAVGANAAAVKAALIAGTSLTADVIDVTHVVSAGVVTQIEFIGLLARTNVSQITADDALAVGGQVLTATPTAGIGPRASSVTDPAYDGGTADTTYFYKVRAKNAEGEGAASNEVAIRLGVSTEDTDDLTESLRYDRVDVSRD